MTPSASEVRRAQIAEELQVPGTHLCVPKDANPRVCCRWQPDNVKQVRIMMELLIKHDLKFWFDWDDDSVELVVIEKDRPGESGKCVVVSPGCWLIYDGIRLAAFDSYQFGEGWDLL